MTFYLLDLDDDTLLAVMQALPCRLVRGPLLLGEHIFCRERACRVASRHGVW